MSPAETIRACLMGFAANDRATVESLLADDFTFSSPDDPHLDRVGFFERCWPGAAMVQSMEIEHLFVEGSAGFVRYRAEFAGRPAFRNVEFVHVEGGQIRRVEVYYGTPVES